MVTYAALEAAQDFKVLPKDKKLEHALIVLSAQFPEKQLLAHGYSQQYIDAYKRNAVYWYNDYMDRLPGGPRSRR